MSHYLLSLVTLVSLSACGSEPEKNPTHKNSLQRIDSVSIELNHSTDIRKKFIYQVSEYTNTTQIRVEIPEADATCLGGETTLDKEYLGTKTSEIKTPIGPMNYLYGYRDSAHKKTPIGSIFFPQKETLVKGPCTIVPDKNLSFDMQASLEILRGLVPPLSEELEIPSELVPTQYEWGTKSFRAKLNDQVDVVFSAENPELLGFRVNAVKNKFDSKNLPDVMPVILSKEDQTLLEIREDLPWAYKLEEKKFFTDCLEKNPTLKNEECLPSDGEKHTLFKNSLNRLVKETEEN